MQDYGKIIFYTKEKYCQIIIKSNKTNTYNLNKEDSQSLMEALSKHKNIFNKEQIKNNIYINLNTPKQLEIILNICEKYKIKPKKQRLILYKINKYLGRILVTTAILKILSPVLIIEANDIDVEKPTPTRATTQYDTSETIPDEIPTEPEITITEEEPIIIEDELTITEQTTEQSEKEPQEETQENTTDQEITLYSETQENTTFQTFYYTFNINDINIDERLYNKYNTTIDYYYDLFEKYGNMYGIDPNLISYIAAQEKGIHSETQDSGGAIGLCQHQIYWTELDILTRPELSLDEKLQAFTISAYNFETNSYDNLLPISDYSRNNIDNSLLQDKILIDLSNIEDNIRLCAAKLAIDLIYFNHDLIATIVSYNQGRYRTEGYIEKYATNNGISYQESLNSKNWLTYIGNTGDPNYIYNVLRFAIASENDTITCTYIDENNYTCDVQLTIEGDNILSNKAITH